MRTALLLSLGAAIALAGCTFPVWQPDAAVVVLQGGQPVTNPYTKDPVTGRDWACKCHCKACLQ
jgi:hypothetical protein